MGKLDGGRLQRLQGPGDGQTRVAPRQLRRLCDGTRGYKEICAALCRWPRQRRAMRALSWACSRQHGAIQEHRQGKVGGSYGRGAWRYACAAGQRDGEARGEGTAGGGGLERRCRTEHTQQRVSQRRRVGWVVAESGRSIVGDGADGGAIRRRRLGRVTGDGPWAAQKARKAMGGS